MPHMYIHLMSYAFHALHMSIMNASFRSAASLPPVFSGEVLPFTSSRNGLTALKVSASNYASGVRRRESKRWPVGGGCTACE